MMILDQFQDEVAGAKRTFCRMQPSGEAGSLESIPDEDFTVAINVLEKYAQLVKNSDNFKMLIKSNSNLQKLNGILSVINKTKKKQDSKSQALINKSNTHLNAGDAKLPNSSKWLKSMAGSGNLTRDDIPNEGEFMDSCDRSLEKGVLVSTVSQIETIDPLSHLRNLKTSTTITDYHVKKYSDKVLICIY